MTDGESIESGADAPSSAREREGELERGRDLEGYAFTFCKAAFLALVLQRFDLLVTSTAAAGLYVMAARAGVREWRCFVKPPWVVAFFAVVAVFEAVRLRPRRS